MVRADSIRRERAALQQEAASAGVPAALERGSSFERFLAAGGAAMVGSLSISAVKYADHVAIGERDPFMCPGPALPCWPPLVHLQHLDITETIADRGSGYTFSILLKCPKLRSLSMTYRGDGIAVSAWCQLYLALLSGQDRLEQFSVHAPAAQLLIQGSPFSMPLLADRDPGLVPLAVSLHAKTICFSAGHSDDGGHHQLAPGTAVNIHPAEPVMTLATGTAADITQLLAVPPGCQLRIHTAHLAVPWSVAGLDELDGELQQQFAAICDSCP